jgi:hypothetical protein
MSHAIPRAHRDFHEPRFINAIKAYMPPYDIGRFLSAPERTDIGRSGVLEKRLKPDRMRPREAA